MDKSNSEWVTIQDFTGFKTKSDAQKIGDGDNPNGQNSSINNGDRISPRNLGYEDFSTGLSAFATTDPITSTHTFRKRDGSQILMCSFGTYLCYYNTITNTWESLKSDASSGAIYGFADYTLHTDQSSFTYFGNAVDTAARWSGAIGSIASTTSNSITLNQSISAQGFSTASGTLIINDIEFAYTGSSIATFTGVTPDPSSLSAGKGVAQVIEESVTTPVGNIYLISSNRLFIAGVTTAPQAIFFSLYGDPTDFTSSALVTGSTATASGTFNLGEGGGAVVALREDEESIYAFKNSITYAITLTDELYTLKPLKPFDGKSQTTGAINHKSVFAGTNSLFVITVDRQILSLERAAQIDYPQFTNISDEISPTTNAGVYGASAGITFQSTAYLAYKSDGSSVNNTVLLRDTVHNFWESPVTGWNASDFSVYQDGTEEELYFGSSNSTNVYKVNTTPTDNDFNVLSNWRSKRYNFGLPYWQKEMSNLFIEGYIAQDASLTISLLLDENGYTQTLTTTLQGTETGFLFEGEDFNLFGLNQFGFERFGGNDDESAMKPFRIYLSKNVKTLPFYNAQLEFASDGKNEQWEVTQFAFKVRPFSQPEDKNLYREFTEL